jgi:sugar lactone lactonase YvrE
MNDVRPSDLRSLERRVTAWMADEAAPAAEPSELEQILTETSRVRPEPRWLALLKEPPMRISGPRVAVGMPARGLVLLALIGLLAVAAIAVVAGSRLVTSNVPPIPSARVPASAPIEAAVFAWRSTGPGQQFDPGSNIDIDPQGRVWVADPVNGRFAIFASDGTFVEYWGAPGTAEGQFNLRRANGDGYGGVAFEPDGSFFVLDVGNFRVQQFDAGRQFVQAWGSKGTGPGQYVDPIGIDTGPDGTLYVLDDEGGSLEKFDATGTLLGTIDVFGAIPATFNGANGIAVEADGSIYISRVDPYVVNKFDATGKLVQTFGAKAPGKMTEQPLSMAIDSHGRLFVTQGPLRGSTRGVLVYEADGTYLSGIGPLGSADGELLFPCGVALDGKGNLYVEDGGDVMHNNLSSGSLQLFRLGAPLWP